VKLIGATKNRSNGSSAALSVALTNLSRRKATG
jgi:hypothetical protein